MDDNQTLTGEQWKPVPGASRYEVSNLGRLRSLINVNKTTGEPYLLRWALSRGYCSTRIHYDDGVKRTVFAHRLVAAAFLGARPAGMMVLHGNDIRTDNRLENLRYGTRADNAADARRNGSHLPRGPEPTRPGKLGAATVRAIRNRINDGETVIAIAKSLGLDYRTVHDVASGRSYAHIRQSNAEQARAHLEVHARIDQARVIRDTRRALANVEALERVEPPEGQRRRRAPHTPPTSAPRSKAK